MITDFQSIYTEVLDAARVPSSDTVFLPKVKRIINRAYDEIIGRPWPFLQRPARLAVKGRVNDGTVAVTNGSATVTGTSTKFLTKAVKKDWKFKVTAYEEIYDVNADATTETSLTLASNYMGTTATGVAYNVWQDTYSLASDFRKAVDWRQFFTYPYTLEHMGIRKMMGEAIRNAGSFKKPSHYSLFYDSTGTKKVMVFPISDADITFPYDYIVRHTTLSADADVPLIPQEWRYIVVLKAIMYTYRDLKDDDRFGSAFMGFDSEHKKMCLEFAMEDDFVEFVPQNMGRPHTKMPISRYSIGSYFDRMGPS